MRALAWPARILAAILLMLAFMAAGLWWWSGTEGSLEWTLRRVGRTLPLTAEGVTGSLRSGLRAQRLVWVRAGLRAEATSVHLEWQPLAMLSRTLQLDEMTAASVQIVDEREPGARPLRPPSSLALPLRVKLTRFSVDRLHWKGRREVQATDVLGSYAFDGSAHRLRLDALQLAQGKYSGQAELGIGESMPLRATLQGTVTAPVPGSTATLPLTFGARAAGPLADLQTEAILRSAQAQRPQQTVPSATVTARIHPFDAQPVVQAAADLRHVDLGSLWPRAPKTSLSGRAEVRPAGTATWEVSADLRNAQPGPWDRGQLPLDQLQGEGEWRSGQASVRTLQARLGAGRVQGSGRWSQAGWLASAELEDVQPDRVHSMLAAVPVSGIAQAREEGEAILFEIDLRGRGTLPKGPAAGLALQRVRAEGRWEKGLLTLPQLQARVSDATLEGALTARPKERAGSGKLRLEAPGLLARFEGELARAAGRGRLTADIGDAAQLQGWLRRIPHVGDALMRGPLSGRAALQGAWEGGWDDPAIHASLQAAHLAFGEDRGAWQMRDALAVVNGRLRDARIELRGNLQQGQRHATWMLEGRAGRRQGLWRADVARLWLTAEDPGVGPGAWRLELRRPFPASWSQPTRQLQVGAGEALLSAPQLAGASASRAVLTWQPVRWGGGDLHTAGRLSGLPMSWLEFLGAGRFAGVAVSGDLLFDAAWDASFGRTLRLDASLTRTGGDVTVLAETAEGGSARVAAGVSEARLTLDSQGENVSLALRWNSLRAGTAEGRLVTRLSRTADGGWEWPDAAPVAGFVRAQLPRIGVWSLLAPPGWRLRGSLSADIALGGTRANPGFSGAVQAEDLGLRSVVDGIELGDGRLRARLDGRTLRIEEFVLRGAGEGNGGGILRATGEGKWAEGGPQLEAAANFEKLRASIRRDRQLTISGAVEARVDAKGAAVNGRLVVDQARIQIPEETKPKLDEDVVVRNAAGSIETAQQRKQRDPQPRQRRPVDVAVEVNLGNDFRVAGRGIDTRLRGDVTLSGETVTQPRLTGTVRSVEGEFQAYGQRLEIERGLLRFTGPPDDPVVDVLAIRPRLEQRVGVQVTGRAQAPLIRLYSEPEMADAQKLALLVTGREAPSTGAEAALLQQAALALLGSRRGSSPGAALAKRFGLEELSVRRDQDAGGAVVALGKRFSRDLYASYERSLGAALGTLYIFYDVSRRVTVRAQAGERSGVDLIFTLSYD